MLNPVVRLLLKCVWIYKRMLCLDHIWSHSVQTVHVYDFYCSINLEVQISWLTLGFFVCFFSVLNDLYLFSQLFKPKYAFLPFGYFVIKYVLKTGGWSYGNLHLPTSFQCVMCVNTGNLSIYLFIFIVLFFLFLLMKNTWYKWDN